MRGRKGNIPITVFAVLTVGVFAFSLLSFSLGTRNNAGEMSEPAGFVLESVMAHEGAGFAGEGGEIAQEKFMKTGWLWWGKELLKLSVKWTV